MPPLSPMVIKSKDTRQKDKWSMQKPQDTSIQPSDSINHPVVVKPERMRQKPISPFFKNSSPSPYTRTPSPNTSLKTIVKDLIRPKSASSMVESIEPGEITLERILQRYQNFEDLPIEEQKSAIANLTRVRLDRLQITSMNGIELVPKVTHLYLQHNLLVKLPSKVNLDSLVFLTLSNNRLKQISGLNGCHNLKLLDASDNLISELEKCTFPQSLEYLVLRGNPCDEVLSYRASVILKVPGLVELDEIEVSLIEKRLAGNFGIIEDVGGEDVEEESQLVLYNDKQQEQTVNYESRVSQIIARSKQRQDQPVASQTISQLIKVSMDRRRNHFKPLISNNRQ